MWVMNTNKTRTRIVNRTSDMDQVDSDRMMIIGRRFLMLFGYISPYSNIE